MGETGRRRTHLYSLSLPILSSHSKKFTYNNIKQEEKTTIATIIGIGLIPSFMLEGKTFMGAEALPLSLRLGPRPIRRKTQKRIKLFERELHP